MSIRHKRKSTSAYTWLSTDLVDGQLGLNTADGTIHLKKTDNSIKTIGVAQTLNSLLPTQTGNTGKFLTTDGSNSSWATAGGSGSSVDLVSYTYAGGL